MIDKDLLIDLLKVYIFDLDNHMRIEDYLKIVDKIYNYLLTRKMIEDKGEVNKNGM